MIDGVPLIGDRKLPPSHPLTREEFLYWADEDSHAEWVDDTVFVSPPDSLDHHDVVAFLYELLARTSRHGSSARSSSRTC